MCALAIIFLHYMCNHAHIVKDSKMCTKYVVVIAKIDDARQIQIAYIADQ